MFLPHKVISALPDPLEPDALYAVRVGAGFDLYIADSTGSVAHKINLAGNVTGDLDFGSASRITNLPAPAADNDAARRVDLVFDQVVILADVKAYNVKGGTFTAGAWRTRDLNTVVAGADYVTLDGGTGEFILDAGTWLITADAPAYMVNRHFTRIWNSTDAAEIEAGQASWAYSVYNQQSVASVAGIWVSDGSKEIEIEHQSQSTKTTDGFGRSHEISGHDSIYTVVKAYRIA